MDGKTSYLARPLLAIALSYLLLVVVGCLDYVSGYEVHLGMFYLLAVAVAGWNLPARHLIGYALVTVALWSGAEYLSGAHYSKTWLIYWSVSNHLGVVTITASMVAKAKATLNRQQRLIRDLGQTLLKVSQFKELVPVCRLCHELHLDDGYHARLEKLVHEGADMDSIGNVCPSCLAERAARVTRIPTEPYFQTDAT